MTRELLARDYRTNEPTRWTLAGGRLVAREPLVGTDAESLPILAPSFCDPQINGALGYGFTRPNLDEAAIRTIAAKCRQHGIGRFAPTVITADATTIVHSLKTLAAVLSADAELAHQMPMIHLEGPYLSPDDGPRGAHPQSHIRDPNWLEFQQFQAAAGGRIGVVTIAPERPGAVDFIRKVCATVVRVAIGHTNASAEEIGAAIDAGASASTHLGNGCHATLPRHANPIWPQLADDRLIASVIADGFHLPPAVLKTFVRAKGIGRIMLTCDAGSLAGLPTGRYREWDTELEVRPDGALVVPGTPFFAGSGVFTDHCLGRFLHDAELTLADAIEAASITPRRWLGLPIPTLKVGDRAEYVVFDTSTPIRVQEVIG